MVNIKVVHVLFPIQNKIKLKKDYQVNKNINFNKATNSKKEPIKNAIRNYEGDDPFSQQ